MEAYPTLYRVAGHDPKAGTIDLEDVLLGGSVTVHDQLMSENIEDNMFFAARVFPAGSFHFIELAGPPLGAGMGLEAVEYLRRCEDEIHPGRPAAGRPQVRLALALDGPVAGQPKADGSCATPMARSSSGTSASFSVADPDETRRTLMQRRISTTMSRPMNSSGASRPARTIG